MDHTTADIIPSEEIDFVPDEHEVNVPETKFRKLVNKQGGISDVNIFVVSHLQYNRLQFLLLLYG